jgi:C-terminal processing protease CtpA/Prc
VVLINKGSAIVSEILIGALHDNGHVILVGQNTYGKGKIQVREFALY